MGDEFVRDVEWLEPTLEAQWDALQAIQAKAEELNLRFADGPRPPSAVQFEAVTRDRSRVERSSTLELRQALAALSLDPTQIILWTGHGAYDAVSWQVYAHLNGGEGEMSLRISGSDVAQVDVVRAELERWWRVARPGAREVPEDWGFEPVESFELVRADAPRKAHSGRGRAFWANPWVLGIGLAVVSALLTYFLKN